MKVISTFITADPKERAVRLAAIHRRCILLLQASRGGR